MVQTGSSPRSVAVVGAGVVGLCAAWFLQERGVSVTVLDRTGVAAGASWGNAGLLTPTFTMPMPQPALLRHGVRSLLDPASPVSVPLSPDRDLWGFLLEFAKNCTPRRWRRSMAVFQEANRVSLATYDELAEGGVTMPVTEGTPLLVACATRSDLQNLVEELEEVRNAGGRVDYNLASGADLRALEPTLSADVRHGALVHGQRFVHPPNLAHALADAVRSRGGTVVDTFDVTAVRDHPDGVELASADGRQLHADMAVLASGAWLGGLARRFGVRARAHAGRGYSFSVTPQAMPTHPIYLSAQQVACNPLGDRFRVTGGMEFRPADAPFNPRRVHTIIESARPMFCGIDWNARYDEWVGSRPCTADGLPLVGATTSPRVHVCGGHGMWGVVFGPLTGKLLAEEMTTGRTPPLMRFFDPLR